MHSRVNVGTRIEDVVSLAVTVVMIGRMYFVSVVSYVSRLLGVSHLTFDVTTVPLETTKVSEHECEA